jgi:hypothetical protein
MVGGGEGVSPIVALERRERGGRCSERRKDLEGRSLCMEVLVLVLIRVLVLVLVLVVFVVVGRVAHVLMMTSSAFPPYISSPPPLTSMAEPLS